MKRLIYLHQKYEAISRVLDSYATVFEGKTKAQAVKDLFTQQLTAAGDHISKLLRPVSAVYRPKQDIQQQFLTETLKIIGMGNMLAKSHKDNPLLDLLKDYNSRIRSISGYKQYEAAMHVVEELNAYPDSLEEVGLTPEKLTAYTDLCAAFENKIEETGEKLDARKLRRLEAKQLVQACTDTVRLQLDPFVQFNQEDYPEFYDAYYIVRGVRTRRRKTVQVIDNPVDLSGMITDKDTGLPVANAVVNLIGLDLATQADEQGYYLFEDLPATALTIACYKFGYELPEQVSMVAQEGESLVVNFALTPAVALPEAS